MTSDPHPLPAAYRSTIRTVLRYAIVMSFVALVSGVLFQESAKRLDRGVEPQGLHLDATLQLALVHGHIFVLAVLLPTALIGLLVLARRIGGGELRLRSLRWLTRGFLPLATLTLTLMLWKGYHELLAVRGGESDLVVIDQRFFFGQTLARHATYGIVHVGMALCLGVFLVVLWRSLPKTLAD